jgi:hypothetical protein
MLIMAADQGKFGRLGQLRRAWSPPGVRPTVAKQLVREYVYAFAAVAPALGQMTALVLPYANKSDDESVPGTGKSRVC